MDFNESKAFMLHELFQTLFVLFADIFSPWADELYNFFRSRLLLASHMFTVFFRRHVQLGCVFMMPFVSSAQSVHSTRLKKWVSFGVGNLERLNCTGPSLQVSCSEPPGVVTTTNPSLFPRADQVKHSFLWSNRYLEQ